MSEPNDLTYREVVPTSRPELERLLESGNERAIIDALLSAAFYESDWRWVQNTCPQLLAHPAKWVRWNAATCLGHIARIHKDLDVEIVLPRLHALEDDSEIGSSVQDALDDISWYLRPQ